MGAPKSTICRFCGGGDEVAEIVRGAHRKCYVAHYVRLAQEKRGPNKCNRCGVVIPSEKKLCGPCKIEARREVQARYNAKRNATKLCTCGYGDKIAATADAAMPALKVAAKRKKKAKHKGPIEDLMESLRQRIRELNAEIAVRDNSAIEVLRILRDATGRRDFHSEIEAAEWAAKLLAQARANEASNG